MESARQRDSTPEEGWVLVRVIACDQEAAYKGRSCVQNNLFSSYQWSPHDKLNRHFPFLDELQCFMTSLQYVYFLWDTFSLPGCLNPPLVVFWFFFFLVLFVCLIDCLFDFYFYLPNFLSLTSFQTSPPTHTHTLQMFKIEFCQVWFGFHVWFSFLVRVFPRLSS